MNNEAVHNNSIKYRSDIDGLRAIAILAVVIYHAFPSRLPGGFVGVDIFFVISGYLITSIILKKLDMGNFSFIDFYIRRIKRIFPALLTVLTACYFFGWQALFVDEFKALGKHVLSGIAFVQNFVLYFEAGYFDSASELKPLMHLWSLSIEEQFYLIFPIIMLIVWKLRLNVLIFLLLVIGFSFSLNIEEVSVDPASAFFMPYTRFWELMSGSLLAYLLMFNKDWTYKSIELIIFRSSKKHSNDMLLKHLLSIVGLSLIITSFFIINKSSVFPGWLATITVSGAFLMILAGPYAIFNKYILSNKLIVWVGLISYPLYLWHWPILSFARIVESELPSREIRIYAVIASFILSWLTYVLIEKPFRFGKYSGIKTIALLIIAIITGSIGYYTYINEGIANRKVIVDEKSANNLIVGPIWSYTTNDICLNTYHSDFPKDYGWWFCIQDKPTKPTILLLGNSYANHLYPGLIHNKHLKEQNILSIGTCGAEQVESYERMGEESRTPCTGTHHYRSQEFINNIIKDNPTIKYVIINGLRNVIYKDYIRRLKKKIDFLESKGITVIVFIPHIKLGYDIKGCFARPFKTPSKSCEMPISVQKAQLKAYSVMINQFKKTNPNVKFFDQNNLLCKDDTCEFKIDGMPVYRDNTDHFSEYASNKLAELFVEWANDNVPNILDK